MTSKNSFDSKETHIYFRSFTIALSFLCVEKFDLLLLFSLTSKQDILSFLFAYSNKKNHKVNSYEKSINHKGYKRDGYTITRGLTCDEQAAYSS